MPALTSGMGGAYAFGRAVGGSTQAYNRMSVGAASGAEMVAIRGRQMLGLQPPNERGLQRRVDDSTTLWQKGRMGKASIQIALQFVIGNMASVFLGCESVKGWLVGAPSAWLESVAGWPLYLSFAVGAVCTFCVANWFIGAWIVAYRRRCAREEQQALIEAAEGIARIMNSQDRLDPMESLALHDIFRSRLRSADIAPAESTKDTGVIMHCQRLLPHLGISVAEAKRAVHSWNQRGKR